MNMFWILSFQYKNSINIQRLIVTTVAIVTLLVLFFGLSHFGMTGHSGQKLVNCPFMPGHSSICKMSPMEHIQAWQSMFTVLPAKEAILLLTLLALLVLLGFRTTLYATDQFDPDSYKNLFYKNKIPIPNSLKEAFSSGILNPKLF